MKNKLIVAVVLVALAGFLAYCPIVQSAPTYAKALVYRWNNSVNIYITSAPCSIDKYKSKYPYAAKAIKKVNGKIDYLVACYTGQGETIIIQWQDINGKPTDTTGLEANRFEELTDEDRLNII